MKLLCFGIAKEILGGSTIDVPQDHETVGDLRSWLIHEYPELNRLQGFMIAINQSYALDQDEITHNDELALLPPVSGG